MKKLQNLITYLVLLFTYKKWSTFIITQNYLFKRILLSPMASYLLIRSSQVASSNQFGPIKISLISLLRFFGFKWFLCFVENSANTENPRSTFAVLGGISIENLSNHRRTGQRSFSQCNACYTLFGLNGCSSLYVSGFLIFPFLTRFLISSFALILEVFDLNLEFLKKIWMASLVMLLLSIKELAMFFLPSKVDDCWEP